MRAKISGAKLQGQSPVPNQAHRAGRGWVPSLSAVSSPHGGRDPVIA